MCHLLKNVKKLLQKKQIYSKSVKIIQMTKSKHTPLNRNELEIVKLTVEGKSQMSIGKQIGLSASTISRTLKRPHVIEKMKSSTQELHFPFYLTFFNSLRRAHERLAEKVETMDTNQLLKYTAQGNPFILPGIINTEREELKNKQEAEEEPVKIKIKYSDTDYTIRREALKVPKEWGYDEPPMYIGN